MYVPDFVGFSKSDTELPEPAAIGVCTYTQWLLKATYTVCKCILWTTSCNMHNYKHT